MNSEVIIIEKTLADMRLRVHYSKWVGTATIKIIFRNRPTIKWTQEFKGEFDYENFKDFVLTFLFADVLKTEDMINFLSEKCKEDKQ